MKQVQKRPSKKLVVLASYWQPLPFVEALQLAKSKDARILTNKEADDVLFRHRAWETEQVIREVGGRF